FGGIDALPDPLGWLLVVAGLLGLRRDVPLDGWLLALAALAGLVSVPLVLPGVRDGLDPSTGWALSLPQTVFCAVLCGSLGVAAAAEGVGEGRVGARGAGAGDERELVDVLLVGGPRRDPHGDLVVLHAVVGEVVRARPHDRGGVVGADHPGHRDHLEVAVER